MGNSCYVAVYRVVAMGIAPPAGEYYPHTVSLKLDIPDDVLSALRLPPAEAEGEMRKELALGWYTRGVLGFGKARALAGLSVWEFDELLGARGVIRPYGKTDLEMDLSYARGN
jgi:predicted HTH domain antitoxin